MLVSGLSIKDRLCCPSTSDANIIKFPYDILCSWEVVKVCTLVAATNLIDCTSVRRISARGCLSVCVCVFVNTVYLGATIWLSTAASIKKFPHIWWQRWDWSRSSSKLPEGHPAKRSPTTGYKLNLCFKFSNIFYINPYPIVCAYCLCLCTLFQDLVFCSSAVHLTILDKQWLERERSIIIHRWTPRM